MGGVGAPRVVYAQPCWEATARGPLCHIALPAMCTFSSIRRGEWVSGRASLQATHRPSRSSQVPCSVVFGGGGWCVYSRRCRVLKLGGFGGWRCCCCHEQRGRRRSSRDSRSCRRQRQAHAFPTTRKNKADQRCTTPMCWRPVYHLIGRLCRNGFRASRTERAERLACWPPATVLPKPAEEKPCVSGIQCRPRANAALVLRPPGNMVRTRTYAQQKRSGHAHTLHVWPAQSGRRVLIVPWRRR